MLRTALFGFAMVAGCRAGVDVDSLRRQRGLDGAAAELEYRLASQPADPDLLIALATIEEQRERPGAALAAFDRASAVGRPFRAGLDDAGRRRLAAVVVTRAWARVARGSPGALPDVERAATLGAAIPDDLRQRAALIAVGFDFAHTDPDRRAQGAQRLLAIDPARAAGLRVDASDEAIATTASWLDDVGAYRAAFELLDRRVERGLAEHAAPAWPPSVDARWLRLRRWWSGTLDPIDAATLDRMIARGLDTCAYSRGPRDPGCDVIAAAGSELVSGPSWEPALVVAWQRDGWRATDRDAALAWMIVAARAVSRGQLPSWERAIIAHIDVPGLADDPLTPSWARAIAIGAVPDDAPPAIAALLASRASPAPLVPWSLLAATIAAGDAAIDPQRLRAIASAFADDPALADRRANELAATAIDIATVAPPIARLFALEGDPARAQAWWQRGFDASPDEFALGLGLGLAMSDAGEADAALQILTRVAAESGDVPRTWGQAARGFAAAGQPLAALTVARQAIEASAPGDEDAAAGLATALLTTLGRTRTAAEVATLSTIPSTGDLSDAAAEVQRLRRAVDLAPLRAAAIARLASLASDDDPALARLARAALVAAVADGSAGQ